MPEKIGEISVEIINLLELTAKAGTPIYIGQSNIEHMKKRHPEDYRRFGANIRQILQEPDFVALNEKDNSIEYVKEFLIDDEYVKIAVRASLSGQYYARSLYVLNKKRVQNFIKKGKLKPLTKSKE